MRLETNLLRLDLEIDYPGMRARRTRLVTDV